MKERKRVGFDSRNSPRGKCRLSVAVLHRKARASINDYPEDHNSSVMLSRQPSHSFAFRLIIKGWRRRHRPLIIIHSPFWPGAARRRYYVNFKNKMFTRGESFSFAEQSKWESFCRHLYVL